MSFQGQFHDTKDGLAIEKIWTLYLQSSSLIRSLIHSKVTRVSAAKGAFYRLRDPAEQRCYVIKPSFSPSMNTTVDV